MKPAVILQCAYTKCNKDFRRRNGKHRFCSLRCKNLDRYSGHRIKKDRAQRPSLTPFTIKDFLDAPPEKAIRLLGRL